MYPDFYELLKSLFGIELPALSLLKTFGFLVAMSFLAAGVVLYKELKRREDDKLIDFTIDEITIGKPLSVLDYLMSGLIGFALGYKLIGMFMDRVIATPDPMSYIFSNKGSVLAGIVFAIAAIALKFFTYKKESVNGVVTKKVKTFPSHRVGDIAMIAAFGGFAGAKIFNAFETWEDFLKDPLGSLFSSSGLTFYGGLIVATIALWIYARRIKLDFRHLCDAAAPALILAYAIGRLGCQVSGDGDWGIYNAAYITNEQGKVVSATQPFEETKKQYEGHLKRHFSKNDSIPSKSVTKFAGLPTWFFAYNYPGNVNNIGVPLANCEGDYCSVLPIPVFPTPVYEFLMGAFIFLVLWMLRKKFQLPLSIFSIYLMFNGVERYLIEQIRVNYQYNIGSLKITQAEIIAICIFLIGILLFMLRKKIDDVIRKHVDTVPNAI